MDSRAGTNLWKSRIDRAFESVATQEREENGKLVVSCP